MHWPTPKSATAFELFGSTAPQFLLQSWSLSKRLLEHTEVSFFAKDGPPMAIVGTTDYERT